MQRFIISLILILSTLFLSSCSIGGLRTEMLKNDNSDKKADERLEQVIETIKNKDKNAMKSMFSKRALSETVDFDSRLDKLLNIFQRKIDSWEKSDGATVLESTESGHNKKEVKSYYYVNTNNQKYFFLLQDYPVDTDNQDNVGLYMLLVVKAEDEEKIYDENQKILYDGNKKLSHAGIYIPLE